MMISKIIFILIFSLYFCNEFTSVLGADRSKFKTCSESGFCRRNRNIKGKPNKWVLDPKTVQPSDNKLGFEAILKNELNGVLLRLTINAALKDSSVLHVRINEAHPGRERYDPREALVENIEYGKINIGKPTDKDVTLTFGPADASHKVLIAFNPFRVDIFTGDRLVVSANAREFLKFEHFRQKRENVPEEEKLEEEEDGGWEETFKSFVDSKPYGPMSVGMDFSFVGFDHVYGLPEHADSFALKNTRDETDPYRFYNVDIFEYELNNGMALYGAIPFMAAHSEDYSVGLLWLNPSETWVDIESSNQGVRGLFSHLVSGEVKSRLTHWFSETGLIDVWIMLGPTPLDVMRQNGKITGTLELPPYYAIGYHQCRWNYFSQEELNEVERQFDANDLPLDVLWLDIEYTEGRSKKYFTWDPVMFSDPKGLITNLTSKGRQLVAIIDPHIKKDTNYPIYNEAVQNNYFIKNKDGNDYEGYCWPGPALYPDFLNPAVREWWSSKFNPEFFPGFTDGNVGIWNDMNEPSVFNGPEMSAPRDVVHMNGIEHRDIHNMYGFLVTKATYKGLTTFAPNRRPFILTRSFFAGSQRYAMVWTGDNMAKWEHLKMSIPMILSLGISGMAFSGADAPGFFYDPESTELVVRWYQAAAFQPFYRAHAHLDTKHREPYLYDEETKNLIRLATRARYSYLPYIYTLFYEASINGTPIMRPVWLHFPKDAKAFNLEEEYLLGDSLLIRPVLDKGVSSVNVYFPGEGESWLGIEDDTIYQGGSSADIHVTLDSIPRFQRAGSIIVKRERMRRSCSLSLGDPMTLQIFLDAEERHAEGKLYLDDGSSYNYKSGGYILAEVIYDKMVLTYRIIHGSFPTNSWLERVVIHRISNKPSKIEATNGANLSFKYNPTSQTLIIRKPSLMMGDSWQIKLS